MEELKPTRFYERFGFKVLLFNVILLLSITVSTLVVRNMDRKQLMDRSTFQNVLFAHAMDVSQGLGRDDWPAAIDRFPRILYKQRILVLGMDNLLVFDSGETAGPKLDLHTMSLLLPEPYVDTVETSGRDPQVLVAYLQTLDLAARVEGDRQFGTIRSIRYDDGVDRVLIMARKTTSGEGEEYLLVMCQSVVDLLIQGRAVKERLLVLYAAVVLVALILTLALSRSVTRPLKRLYLYLRHVVNSSRAAEDTARLPVRGEIGGICRAVQGLFNEQTRQAERFREFSADVVHELRTPLAAIRSSVELSFDSADEAERQQMYARVGRRIRQMESLMDEIRLVGTIESRGEGESCGEIRRVAEDIAGEYANAEIAMDFSAEVDDYRLPIACEKTYRLLANLVANAVSLSPRRGSVHVSVRVENRAVVAEVRDRGPGIPEEVFPEITKRFVTYRPEGGGTNHSGLGLAIVTAILRSCGGSLSYGNRPEGGARFTCRIPAAK